MSEAMVQRRFDHDLRGAERLLGPDPRERRIITRGLLAALVIHGALLWGQLPRFGPAPVRVDAPAQMMQVQFLKPPPAAPKTRPPEPEQKKIARPDPTPEELEPEAAPEAAPPALAEGPVRVATGQGPGLIKRVEPVYPPVARAARIEGTVVLDAVILKDGSVSDITVLRSASAILERSAIDALKQWRFTEGDRDVIMTLTVHFILK
jgi:TonB family protein